MEYLFIYLFTKNIYTIWILKGLIYIWQGQRKHVMGPSRDTNSDVVHGPSV